MRQRRHQFLFVVGRLADALAHDQAALHFHGGLRVVALLEVVPIARFHDPAFGIGEVVLVAGFRRRRGGLRWLAANLFAAFLFGGTLGQFLFVLGQLGGVTGMGASLDLGAGLRQRGLAFLPTGDFVGDRQPVLQRRGVGPSALASSCCTSSSSCSIISPARS